VTSQVGFLSALHTLKISFVFFQPIKIIQELGKEVHSMRN